MPEKSNSTKESTSGKDSRHWQKRIKECLSGKISGKALADEAQSYFLDNGFLFHDALGWVKPEEMDESGVDYTNDKGVPISEVSTKKGKTKRIIPEFLEYQSRKKKEAYGKAQRTLNKITQELSQKFPEF